MRKAVILMCVSDLLGVLLPGWALSDKPNIVIIVADDLGFNDVGFHGGDVRTPNLDALAGHGIILNRHYTLPCCSPSRAALMTGRYPLRTGLQGNPLPAGVPKGLPVNEKIFPQYFKKLGYKSHLVGKWHLGYHTWDHFPTNRGFDSFYGFLNGFTGYYDAVTTERGISGRDFRRNEKPIWEEVYGKYMTDVLSKEAVSVIEKHEGYGGLLLILNHAAPHTGNLDFLRESPPTTANFSKRAVLAEMVRVMDDSVGEVVSTLNQKGVLNNTIIVFFSDNGAPSVDKLYGYDNYGSNWPLRGLKMSSHDGGIRTAAFVWSPIFNKPRVTNDLFHLTDWLPTLYTAAGGASSALVNLDGISQWDSLVSNSIGPRNEVLLNLDEVMNNAAFINGSWKIIRNHDPASKPAFTDDYYGASGSEQPYDPSDVGNSVTGQILGLPPVPYHVIRQQAAINDTCTNKASAAATDCHTKYCLYNILEDGSECQDLSDRYPEVVSLLEAKLEKFRKVLVPPLNDTMDPKSYPEHWDDYWTPWLGSVASKYEASLIFFPMFLVLLHVATL